MPLLPQNYDNSCCTSLPCASPTATGPAVINVWDPVAQLFRVLTAPDGILTLDDGSGAGGALLGGCPTGVVPGPKGDQGDPGTDGVGINAFTLTGGSGFTVPAIGSDVAMIVFGSAWMSVGQIIYIRSAGFYRVSLITDGTDISATNLGYPGNAVAGTVIASAQPIVAAGLQGPAGATGSGVTSVGLTVPSWLTVTNSPVTSAGTLAVTPTAGQTQNRVLATPNGAAGPVSLRVLVAADLPPVPGAGLTGTVPIANGGTGQSSGSAAYNALSPTTTKGDLPVNNGAGNTRLAVGADGLLLTANAASATGLAWLTPVIALTTIRRRVTVSPDVMQATDFVLGWNLAGTASETLVAAPANGRKMIIKDESGLAGTNNITVLAGAGDTIQGSASKVINTNYGYLSLYYDATDKIWFIIGSA